jgi:cytoskeletal protein CcmA (bactofilin family)
MMNKTSDISIIDRELTINGSVTSKGKLIIKGKVKGTVIGETVVIAEEGEVIADAMVTHMTIGGRYEGELQASEELVILQTGNCSGKVVCKDLIVEAGGQLNADITRINGDKTHRKPKAPSPKKDKNAVSQSKD